MTKRLLLLLPATALLALPTAVLAQTASNTHGWSGSGELGFAESSGNSHTQNINAKLGLSQETERWKNNFSLSGLRSKGETVDSNGNTQFTTTANRFTGDASVGFKFDPRSYLVNALRYEHDDFGSNLWQAAYSVGYGYIALKNAKAELSFEVGPGYKRYQPNYVTQTDANGNTVRVKPPVESEAIARSLINGKLNMTPNTSLDDTLLIEAGSQNTYMQNDLGLSVTVTQKLALKLGYQVRFNSSVSSGTKHSDKLMTTNLVYNF